MKKIFISLLAVAALAACTKSEVAYEAPGEIGFNVVGGNITKAVVDGTTYPTTLNMYVFAETTDNTEDAPNYINDGEFTYVSAVEGTNVWGGGSSSTSRNPYYWPNVKTLHFAGYSKSGNAADKGVYSCTNGTLSISGYTPGTGTDAGVNDLMWFPTTELQRAAGYGKADKFVPVNMYHTCSWITFLVKGDEVTGNSTSPYKVTSLTINGIDQTADVKCSATSTTTDGTTTVTPNIAWSDNTTQTEDYTVTFKTTAGVALKSDAATNVETYDATTTSGNIVVIPQTPGKLTLTYTYKSTAGVDITETVTGLNLALAKDNSATPVEGPAQWEPGKHYIYTITIKANEILIAPTPVNWTDSNWNITVE